MLVKGIWTDDRPGDRIVCFQGDTLTEKCVKRISFLLADDLSPEEAKEHWEEIVKHNPANPHDIKVTLIEFR
jgi:hypothetical protein